MNDYFTIPSENRMVAAEAEAEDYMRPNKIPSGVVLPQFLSDNECDLILDHAMDQEPYRFGGCGATTRQLPRPLHDSLGVIEWIARRMNEMHWGFDLDPGPAAWMQTYGENEAYQLHADAKPGQMRKLTAVAMLSSSDSYAGGSLWMRLEPRDYPTDKSRGTVVIFPGWVTHHVDAVTSGTRQTINMGFWGPNFV